MPQGSGNVRRIRVAVPETPQAVAGLRLWLAARKETSYANGAAVATPTNWSGRGNDYTQATGTKQPTWQTGLLDGQPGFRFDVATAREWVATTGDVLAATNAASGITVLVVAQRTGSVGVTEQFCDFRTNTTTSRFKYGYRFVTAQADRWHASGRRLDADAQTNATSGITVDVSWHLHTVAADWSAGVVDFYREQTLDAGGVAWTSAGTTSATNSLQAAIGSQGGSEYLTGDVAELLVYDRVLSAADRQAVWTYLLGFYPSLGSQSFAQTVTDPVGITDTASRVLDAAQTPADAEGLTDAASQAASYAQTATDAVGVTDAASASFVLAQTVTDPVGVTDAAAQAAALAQAPADAEGLTDQASQQAAYAQTATDAVGITDAASASFILAVTVSDPVAISDAGASSALATTLADAVGITDVAGQATGAARSQADAIGLTDTRVVDFGTLVTVSDPVGIADPFAQQAAFVAAPADPVGVTDAALRDLARPLTDQLGLTDAALRDLARDLPADAEGVTDAAAQLAAAARLASDPVGVTDSLIVDATSPAAQTKTDPIGITDSTTWAQANVAPRWTEGTGTAAGLAEGAGSATGARELVGAIAGTIEGGGSL